MNKFKKLLGDEQDRSQVLEKKAATNIKEIQQENRNLRSKMDMSTKQHKSDIDSLQRVLQDVSGVRTPILFN